MKETILPRELVISTITLLLALGIIGITDSINTEEVKQPITPTLEPTMTPSPVTDPFYTPELTPRRRTPTPSPKWLEESNNQA